MQVEGLDANVAESVIGVLIQDIMQVLAELVEGRAAHDRLVAQLAAVKRDIAANLAFFKPRADGDGAPDAAQAALFLNRYRVNVFVDNGTAAHAPVIYEENPTYYNLIGRVDRALAIANGPVSSANMVDHMMLRPGALHRANGGFLALAARDLLDRRTVAARAQTRAQTRADPD